MQDNEVRQLARQFKGLWIPASVIQNTDLSAVDKMLWADIDSFTGNDSTWFKSRGRAAEELGVSERTVTRSLQKLKSHGLIDLVTSDGRTTHYVSRQPRQIVPADEPICPPSRANMSQQGSQNVPIDNSIDKQPRKQPRVVAPTLEEVLDYFDENMSTGGESFFDYFESAGWVRKGGVKIKDWKAAARNWMRNEHKFSTPQPQRKSGRGNRAITATGVIDFIANG